MDIKRLVGESEYIAKTPGGGDAYYHNKKDVAVVVYPQITRVYTERRKGIEGKSASCFNTGETIATRTS